MLQGAIFLITHALSRRHCGGLSSLGERDGPTSGGNSGLIRVYHHHKAEEGERGALLLHIHFDNLVCQLLPAADK